MQPTPTTTDILYTIYFHDKHHRWHKPNSHLFLLDGATVTLPLLPSPSLTHLYKQTTKGYPCQSRSDYAGGARSATLFFWERPSQKYIRWAFHTPRPKYKGGAPSLPYPITQLNLRSPQTNYWQLTRKRPTWAGAFCTPLSGPWAK